MRHNEVRINVRFFSNKALRIKLLVGNYRQLYTKPANDQLNTLQSKIASLLCAPHGEMAEWFKAPVLKTGDG